MHGGVGAYLRQDKYKKLVNVFHNHWHKKSQQKSTGFKMFRMQ